MLLQFITPPALREAQAGSACALLMFIFIFLFFSDFCQTNYFNNYRIFTKCVGLIELWR